MAEVFPVFIDEIRVLFTNQYIDRRADNGRTGENNTFLMYTIKGGVVPQIAFPWKDDFFNSKKCAANSG